jgi:hypothetical protein
VTATALRREILVFVEGRETEERYLTFGIAGIGITER